MRERRMVLFSLLSKARLLCPEAKGGHPLSPRLALGCPTTINTTTKLFYNYPVLAFSPLALPTMEVFSMLRYWRGGGGGGGGGGSTGTPATTISATALQPSYDDGPFFDLEFSVPDEEEGRSSNSSSTTSSGGDEEGAEDEEARDSLTEIKSFDVTVSDNGQTDSNHSPAAEDDDEELFIKGRLVPLEPSGAAVIFNDESQGKQAQFPVSFLKSATRFRVFFLGLKKHPQLPAAAAATAAATVTPPAESPAGETAEDVASTKAKQHQSRFFTVKLKVEEAPLASLFTRDNSRSGSKAKDTPESGGDSGQAQPGGLTEEAKRAKVVMQRYLKAIKPLYERVSKKHGEKVSISGHLSLATPAKPASPEAALETTPASTAPAAPPSKQGSLPAGLRVVYKRLGKSRSASASAAPTVFVQSQRRDDSLLQQQDGIQSAIAHCKRSLKSVNESPPSSKSQKEKVEERNRETGGDSTY